MSSTLTTLWTTKVGPPSLSFVTSVAISSDGRTVAAASDDRLFVLDADGKLLWAKDLDGGDDGVSVSPDGELIATGVSDDYMHLYNRAGGEVWRLPVYSESFGVSISGVGPGVAAVITDQEVIQLFPTSDPTPRWRTSLSDGRAVTTNWDGSVTAVLMDDGDVVFLDVRGELKQWIISEGGIYKFAMDASGTHLAALDSEESILSFYNTDGSLLWTQELRDSASDVAVTAGGELIACASPYSIDLITGEGRMLPQHEVEMAFL
jgi:outer membrane protein assembly factor BamB